MKKKRVLLAGSSFSAAPIFHALKQMGHTVTVCGNNKDDPCHHYADESIYQDYSNKKVLESIFDTKHFDCLVPSCNDAAYIAGAHVAAKHRLPGFDAVQTVHTLHTKAAFRQMLTELNIRTPRYLRIEEGVTPDLSSFQFPVLIKPIDNFSGRGFSKLNNISEYPDAFAKAVTQSNEKHALLEEFLEGTLHSHSAFIVSGKIVAEFFVDEFCSVYPYQVDSSNHPSQLNQHTRSDLRRQIETVVSALQLCDGLMHTQFLNTPTGPVIVESMRRAPGDLYPKLIERSSSYDYIKSYVLGFLGEAHLIEKPSNRNRCISRHTVTTDQKSVFQSLSFPSSPYKIEFFPLKNSGEPFHEAPFDKIGISFSEYENMEKMFSQTPNLRWQFQHSKYNQTH